MKRILAALIILCSILAVSAYSIWQFYQLRQEAMPLLETMKQLCVSDSLSDAIPYAEEFQRLWAEYQPSLTRFARRDPLEHIGKCAARLDPLAEYEDIADFAATVDELMYCLDELWDSEIPSLDQLF